jgi:HEAT repeat protein
MVVAGALLVLGGCASGLGTTASSAMRVVRESPDPNLRHRAYVRLAEKDRYVREEQYAEAATLLVERLKGGKEPVASRAAICRTLGDLGRPEGRDGLLAVIGDESPVIRAEACRALGKIGRAEDAGELSRVMAADASGECRIAAIEGLGALRASDPRVEQMLVEGMKHEDPAVRLASLRALRTLTGADLGVDPEPWAAHVESRLAAAGAAAPAEPPGPAPAIIPAEPDAPAILSAGPAPTGDPGVAPAAAPAP